MFTRFALLVGLSAVVSCSFAADELVGTKLEADLIHVDYPIQIEDGDREVDPLGYLGSRVRKMTIAPRVKSVSKVLPEPVYDVSGFMKANGLRMPAGSLALYSSSAELLFLETTAPDRQLVRTVMSPFPVDGLNLLSVSLLVTRKSATGTETLLEVKTAPFISGQRLEFTSKGEGQVRIFFEPVMGPDGETLDIAIDANIQGPEGSLKKEFSKTMKGAATGKEELGALGDGAVTVQIQTQVDRDYFGPPALETPEKRATAIEEIQKALQAAPTR